MRKFLAYNTTKSLGFTLLELLLVVTIIGILVVLALPILIGTVSKTRGSEALQTLSMALQSQQAHHIELGYFATNWSALNVEPNNTESNYYYTTETTDNRQVAILKATPKNEELRGYLAGIEVVIQKGAKVFPQSLCEVTKPGEKAVEQAVVEFKKRRVSCGEKLKRIK